MEGFIGEIKMFAGTFAPRGWTFCEGQLLAIGNYTALFSIIGDQFGGDGRSTFGVPDLRGRAPIGIGQGPGLTPRLPTQRGGVERVQLAEDQLPAHSHAVNCDTTSVDRDLSKNPEGNVPAKTTDVAYGKKLDGNPKMLDNMVNKTGSGHAHENMQPWIALRYIMCIDGEYPSRP